MKKKQIKSLKISELKVGDILLYKSGENFQRLRFKSKYAKVTQIESSRIIISSCWFCNFRYAEDSFYVLINPILIKIAESRISTIRKRLRKSRTRPLPISII